MRDEDTQLIFEAYCEANGVSRRGFLSMLGRGAAAVATVPWTKLLSAPAIAAKVTAPFKIGAGAMLNPQALYRFYSDKFLNKALDSGITPVDVTDERHYEYEHTEIAMDAFDWVAKNIVNMYVDDRDHAVDTEGDTVSPTLTELINDHGWDEEHFLDNPDFPQWAKDLLGKDEEDMDDEEEQRYQQLMNAKWFDKDLVANWDGADGDGAEEELETMLRTWTGWKGEIPPGFMNYDNPELIDSMFDYILDLNRDNIDINQIMQMNFKQEFLPGVVKHVRELAVAQQARAAAKMQQQAGQDAKTAKDELQKDQLPSRPGTPTQWHEPTDNIEWWTEEDFKWWDRRFNDDVVNSDEIEQYRVIADKIIQNPFDSGLMEFKPEKAKELKQQAHEWIKWYNGTKDLRKPNQAHVKHPYGAGSPHSGLQTMSYRPTFKEYFNK